MAVEIGHSGAVFARFPLDGEFLTVGLRAANAGKESRNRNTRRVLSRASIWVSQKRGIRPDRKPRRQPNSGPRKCASEKIGNARSTLAGHATLFRESAASRRLAAKRGPMRHRSHNINAGKLAQSSRCGIR